MYCTRELGYSSVMHSSVTLEVERLVADTMIKEQTGVRVAKRTFARLANINSLRVTS